MLVRVSIESGIGLQGYYRRESNFLVSVHLQRCHQIKITYSGIRLQSSICYKYETSASMRMKFGSNHLMVKIKFVYKNFCDPSISYIKGNNDLMAIIQTWCILFPAKEVLSTEHGQNSNILSDSMSGCPAAQLHTQNG